jgi:hypothetical protein
MRSDKPSKPSGSPADQSSIEPQRVDNAASAVLSDLFDLEFTPAAVAAFNHRGRRLDALIDVARQQVADVRATLREIISGHPSTGQADATNVVRLKCILGSIS